MITKNDIPKQDIRKAPKKAVPPKKKKKSK